MSTDRRSGTFDQPADLVPIPTTWHIRGKSLDLGVQPLVMGVLNVTPDSFSDGGHFYAPADALARANTMIAEGVDIIDVGGESTRPGAIPVDGGEEIDRVVPIIRALAQLDVPLSVDTIKADVAREALEAGAHIVNNVGALKCDPEVADVVAEYGSGLILMHMQGEPRTMQADPQYDDLMADIEADLRSAAGLAISRGVEPEHIAIDPGVGFGKTFSNNWTLIARLEALRGLGRPIVIGTSRKRFLREVVGPDLKSLEIATAATSVAACLQGARIVRVHDISSHRLAMQVAGKVLTAD